jgi:hypothetical protein
LCPDRRVGKPPDPDCCGTDFGPAFGRLNYRFTAAEQSGTLAGSSRHHYVFSIMGNLKKKRRLQMNKHKRRKRLKANRHKKRTWQK